LVDLVEMESLELMVTKETWDLLDHQDNAVFEDPVELLVFQEMLVFLVSLVTGVNLVSQDPLDTRERKVHRELMDPLAH